MLSIAGFSLDILGRESPGSPDYWDGNWLMANCVCLGQGARVEVSGSIVRVDELRLLLDSLKLLYENLAGTATLQTLEPYLALTFVAKSRGHFDFTVDITPDHLAQKHSFIFDLDQTYVRETIDWLSRILLEYPIWGRPD